MQPEADLVARCLAGDTGAFEALATRYYRPVAAFLLRRVGRPDVVEDLAQETFLEAFRALRDGRRPDNFVSWLFGIAHNRAGKYLRRRKPTLFDPDAPPELPVVLPEQALHDELEEQRHRLAALDGALAHLPPEARQILEMKHQGGLTCEQIATALGRPVGTIKSLLSRTYRALRERLAPNDTGDNS
jgi:RNA polymerase sigma-70 factor (ECF subfamily)